MLLENIGKLRHLFDEYSIDGYLIGTNDEYLSEYTSDYAKRLMFITGFTGSNGILLITKKNAYFFTDGRYLEQSNYELNKDIFEINEIKLFKEFLWSNRQNFTKIGYDPKLFSHQFIRSFSALSLYPIKNNLIDLIWVNKPKKKTTAIYLYPENLTGKSYEDKILNCRNFLKVNNAQALIIAQSESICWLLNLRASDMPHTPVLVGVVLLTSKDIYLFTDLSRVSEEIKRARPKILFYHEEELPKFLNKISDLVLVDYNHSNSWLVSLIKKSEHAPDPSTLARACKTSEEINFIKETHIYDAIAIIEFLSSIEQIDISNYTEFELAQKLKDIRQKQPNYVMDSFATICGFKANGGIIHYHPMKNKSSKLEGRGLLLIDSGGQYLGGTTDVTRTVIIGGKATDEEKNNYTLVLKGHISLANIKFPKGTTGSNLDILARQYLWGCGLNYNHGTGHGVGAFLNVHEGPQGINQHNIIPLEEGMVVSNEPGYYKPGHFGIRIEGLMYVTPSKYDSFLQFSQLTLVPFDKNLINIEMLNDEELMYIKGYYQVIKSKVGSRISKRAFQWLEKQDIS